MNVTEALHDEWNEARGQTPATVAGLVGLLGGTKGAAGVLGVAQRTIERYISRERDGVTKNNRQISGERKDALTRAADAVLDKRLADKVKEDGASADAAGDVDVYGNPDYRGHRAISEQMDGDELLDMLDAIAADDWERAAVAFQDALFDAYGIPDSRFADGDVEEISISFPS